MIIAHNWNCKLRLSLRTRLILIYMLVILVATAASAVVLVFRAREAVRAEVASSLELAKLFVHTAIANAIHHSQIEHLLEDLPRQVRGVRHVTITVLDSLGSPVAGIDDPTAGPRKTAEGGDDAPFWFAEIVQPRPRLLQIPIVTDNKRRGVVAIVATPRDEINEVWDDVEALGWVIAFALCAMPLAIYWALNRALKPIGVINSGLMRLESGDYRVRIPEITTPDLVLIGRHFNALAKALDDARQENSMLNHRLITAQDDERKRIAADLHDELGPCLFGVKVDAASILSAARKADPVDVGLVAERAQAIIEGVEHLQKLNRELLHRLRPMALGKLALTVVLGQLVDSFRLRHPEIDWELKIPADFSDSYGESVDLTIYRLVQEGINNAVRHANAKWIKVKIEISDAPQEEGNMSGNGAAPSVCVVIEDDGVGMPPDQAPGRGLQGMSERVRGLGGQLTVETSTGNGTRIFAKLPLDHMPSVKKGDIAETRNLERAKA